MYSATSEQPSSRAATEINAIVGAGQAMRTDVYVWVDLVHVILFISEGQRLIVSVNHKCKT